FGSRTATREIAAAASAGGAEGDAQFIVILPMLREQRIVREAIGHFAGIARARTDVRLIVAVTAREREQWEADRRLRAAQADGASGCGASRWLQPTTRRIAEEVAVAINGDLQREVVNVVEAPAESMAKVGQINAAVQWWGARPLDRDTGTVFFV